MATAENRKEDNTTFETLKKLYFSGKVKPSLNKILPALEEEPDNLQLIMLACEVLERTKDYEQLSTYADKLIKKSPEITEGYYFKGVALRHKKGKEQDALRQFNKALELDPNDLRCLKSKANTHFTLFKDFDLPIKFADKHRAKAEECLLKVIELVEGNEDASYLELFILADVYMMVEQILNAKMTYLKAVNAYEEAEPETQNKNLYKDLVKAQRQCIRQMEKFTE
jgi:tetratricopeptide (TPR) repeat protein